jgi:glycine dehydrogenase
MLQFIGVKSIDELIEQTVPRSIWISNNEKESQDKLLGKPISESAALNILKEVAKKNKLFKNYIGMGYNPVITPSVILRNILENPAWYTSYTPYQAEISQGRLESLLNYQTLITELTGLPFSNASLLDEATAAAEAMYMAFNLSNGKKKDFFVSSSIFPNIKDTLRARAHYLNINIIEGCPGDETIFSNKNLCGGIVQNPNNQGKVKDYSTFSNKMREIGAVSIVAADILSLLLCKSPGDMGFDIAVGSAQRFGVPMMNGGPHAGFLATRDEFKRKIPGRVVGISKDRHGNPALRLSMQTREQHIRRDKATSNICTAQALLANIAAFFAIFHGKEGLIHISERINLYALYLSDKLSSSGYVVVNNSDEIFDTVTIDINKSGLNLDSVINSFEKHEINVRKIGDNIISITLNETTNLTDLENLIRILYSLKGIKTPFDISQDSSLISLDSNKLKIRNSLRRNTENILKQDVFNKYTSEHQITRYMYYLQMKDISLCNSMITLGSCTMKLNATSEMVVAF